jgi:peptidoglycan/LPS O-acetylase OafA/YrhL
MATTSIQAPQRRQRSPWVRVSFESIASRSAKYRPDVDGLRAIAVLAVLFFHTGYAPFRGGFVGVDIFYVISGYLITSILAKDLAEGKFSLVAFYERRMRRIFPALFTVLFFCIVGGTILFDPREMTALGKTLIATTFFFSNFYFWHSAHPLGYFDNAVSSQALLHTWSLSVEEQF